MLNQTDPINNYTISNSKLSLSSNTDLKSNFRDFGNINNLDRKWNELRFWQDQNEDGITDNGELKTKIKKVIKFIVILIGFLAVSLVPFRVHATTSEEEKLNYYLEDYLKVNGEEFKNHKNKFFQMNEFRRERDKIYQNSSNNFAKYKRGLIADIANKYNLDPRNKNDYCDLMERLIFYLSDTVDDLKGSRAQFCSNKENWCVQVFENRYDGFDESDIGNEIYIYLISDYSGNPIGIWSLFKANYGVTIKNEKYFQISRAPYSDLRSLIVLTKENFLKQRVAISYLKRDGCYLEEIHIRPKIFTEN